MENQILKYLNGQCSAEEQASLESWVSADPSNREEFENIKEIFESSEDISNYKEVNIEDEWNLFQESIKDNNHTPSTHTVKKFNFLPYSIAASLIFLLGAVLFWPSNDIQFVTVDTSHLDQEITLPDNSLVKLAPNSTLKYLNSYDKSSTRGAYLLRGKATYHVTKDTKPFLVDCDDIIVEVLGTVFTVDKTSADLTHVNLIEGSIRASEKSNDTNFIVLKDGAETNFTNGNFTSAAKVPKETIEVEKLNSTKIPTPLSLDHSTSTYRLSDVLQYLAEQYTDSLTITDVSNIGQNDTISLDINSKDYQYLINEIRSSNLVKISKGDCEGCYTITEDIK